MAIQIGYACINTTLPSPNRTCRLNSASPERILELARLNLAALEPILRWNQEQAIPLFRISSETIPFGSHPVNRVAWWEILAPEISALGELIHTSGMRVSMHPGQYTVLNSKREEVVEASIAELVYHARLLDVLGVDSSHKIILHVGGTFGDKKNSMQRFSRNFARLPAAVQQRIALENDEKSYALSDVLALSKATGTPAVFDVFHHTWNPSFPGASLRELVEQAAATWKAADGIPKLHYSDQWPGKPPGAHSQSVDLNVFAGFYEQIQDMTLRVMFEVKDKEQSVLKIYKQFPELKESWLSRA